MIFSDKLIESINRKFSPAAINFLTHLRKHLVRSYINKIILLQNLINCINFLNCHNNNVYLYIKLLKLRLLYICSQVFKKSLPDFKCIKNVLTITIMKIHETEFIIENSY